MFFFWWVINEEAKREANMLREARRSKGLTQQEVAMRVGMDVKNYQRLEYGQRGIDKTSMKTGLALCVVLGLDPMVLVFGEGYTAEDTLKN